jgi:hypothetical protein
MGDTNDHSIADVMKLLQALTTDVSKMQSDMAGMQEKLGSTADSNSRQDGQPPPGSASAVPEDGLPSLRWQVGSTDFCQSM